MQLFRVYLNTTAGRKSLECMAADPTEASNKGRKLYEGSIVVKVKTIVGYTLPAPPEMTQELPPLQRFAHAGPNLQQTPKRVENYGLQSMVAESVWQHIDYKDGEFRSVSVFPHKTP